MLRQWWKQLWCAHSWLRIVALMSRADIERDACGWQLWKCRYCGKRTHRRTDNPPVSFVP